MIESIIKESNEFVQANIQKYIKPWINPYVFTKNLCERAIAKHRGHLRVAIVRPSIVGCCYKEPLPGWIDAVSAMGVIGYPLALGLTKNHCFGNANIALVSGD